ncbi:MAG TPA: hypothetical protein VED16_03795 [Candidatus Acidoferrum sp.]|nr:hypothetical protein [Candidatus Acidoferrum sp.]
MQYDRAHSSFSAPHPRERQTSMISLLPSGPQPVFTVKIHNKPSDQLHITDGPAGRSIIVEIMG